MELIHSNKFCTDCKHIVIDIGNNKLCGAFKASKLDMVTGEYIHLNLPPCSTLRSGLCGGNGAYFESRL